MLNPYFAFGVPIFLVILYLLFTYIHKKNSLHYLRFILLLISTFLLVFSFQVIQESWSMTTTEIDQAVYSPNLLWLPLLVGLFFTLFNLGIVIKQLTSYGKNKQ